MKPQTSNTIKTACLLMICFLTLTTELFGGTALERIKQTGLSGGLVYMPTATDPNAAIEIAANTPFIVFAQTEDRDTALAIRNKGAALNLLSQKLYADAVPASALPIAPYSATIILADTIRVRSVRMSSASAIPSPPSTPRPES